MTSSTNADVNEAITLTTPPPESRLDVINFLTLSPHYPKINAFSSFIGWAVIFVVLLVVNLLIDKIHLPFFILPTIALFSILSALFGYHSAKVCGYFKGEFDVLFKSGLWWKRQTTLSFSRIQHIDISHGPLERKYGMATIKFFTAGGVASDLRIPGLAKETAESLRTEILQYAKSEFESVAEHKSKPEPSPNTESESKVVPELDESKNIDHSNTSHE